MIMPDLQAKFDVVSKFVILSLRAKYTCQLKSKYILKKKKKLKSKYFMWNWKRKENKDH